MNIETKRCRDKQRGERHKERRENSSGVLKPKKKSREEEEFWPKGRSGGRRGRVVEKLRKGRRDAVEEQHATTMSHMMETTSEQLAKGCVWPVLQL